MENPSVSNSVITHNSSPVSKTEQMKIALTQSSQNLKEKQSIIAKQNSSLAEKKIKTEAAIKLTEITAVKDAEKLAKQIAINQARTERKAESNAKRAEREKIKAEKQANISKYSTAIEEKKIAREEAKIATLKRNTENNTKRIERYATQKIKAEKKVTNFTDYYNKANTSADNRLSTKISKLTTKLEQKRKLVTKLQAEIVKLETFIPAYTESQTKKIEATKIRRAQKLEHKINNITKYDQRTAKRINIVKTQTAKAMQKQQAIAISKAALTEFKKIQNSQQTPAQ
jgi:chromosome segregation ATPase